MATGAEKLQALRDAGQPQDAIDAYQQRATVALQQNGISQPEIDAYWNPPQKPATGMAAAIKDNLDANPVKPGSSPMDNFAAGFDMSVVGIANRVRENNRSPEKVLPEDSGILDKLTYIAGRVVGDAPASIAGFMAGGAAGSAVAPGVGTVVGAGAGSAMLPEGIRQAYIGSIEAGKVNTFQDLVGIAAHGVIETGKQGIIGAVTAPIGGAVGSKVLSQVGSKSLSLAADATAQAVTGTAIGGALDGHVPDASDFTVAAAAALGFHVAGTVVGATKRFVPTARGEQVARNSRAIYSKTGIPPWKQVELAKTDPALKQELLMEEADGTPSTRQFGKKKLAEPDPYKAPVQVDEATGQPKAIPAAASPAGLRDLVIYAENTAGYAKSRKVDPNTVVSSAGAIGVHQIMPDTARQYMGKDFDVSTLRDPEVNAKVADKIITDLAKRFKMADGSTDVEAVLIGYNAGPGRAAQFRRTGRNYSKLPAETQKYLTRAEGFTGQLDRGPVVDKRLVEVGGEIERIQARHDAMADGDPAKEALNVALTQLKAAHAKATATAAGGAPPSGNPPAPPTGGAGTPPGGGGPTGLTPAAVAALGPTGVSALIQGAIAQPARPSLISRTMSGITKAYTDYVNERGITRKLDKGPAAVGQAETFEDTFQSLNASRGRADYFLKKGTIADPRTFAAGSDESYLGAYKAAKAAGGTKDGFFEYRLAKQAMADHARGFKTAIDPLVAAQAVRDGNAKYAAADAMVNRVKVAALRYAQKAGVYSQDQVDGFIATNPSHIVQRRDVGDVDVVTGRSGNGVKVSTVKKKTGSDRQLIDPQRADIESLGSVIANADKNVGLLKLVGQDPRDLAAMGISRVPDAPGDLKTVGPRNKNDFIVYHDGQPVTYTIDPSFPDAGEIVKMVHGSTAPEVGVIGKVVNTFATVKRAGVTNMVDFLARNLFRDQMSAAILAKHGGLPMQHLIAGTYHSIFSPDMIKSYARAGGFGAALNEMDTNYFQHNIDRVFSETGTWKAVANAFPDAYHAWHTVVTRLDALGRIGDYASGLKRGESPLQAAMASRRNRLDFAQRGASGLLHRMAMATPFLRPTILGHEQMVRSFMERPVSTTAKAALYITAPSVGLYLLNELADQSLPDDQKYDKVPRWQRDLFWVTPPINGVRILIPKPFVIGQLFGSLPERMLDHYRAENPQAYKDFASNFLGTLTLPLIPASIEPIAENMANVDTMNFRPLIPASLQDASNYMQYSPNTSDTAVALARALGPQEGKMLDVSPIVLQNYVRSWAGSAGNAVLSIVDGAFAPANDVKELKDNPFIGGFLVRNHDMGAAPIQDFYDNVNRITAAHRDVKLAVERQDESEIDFTSANADAYVKITTTQTAMSKMQSAIRATRYDPEMTVDEKRQFIEGMYTDMLSMATEANKELGATK